MSTNGEHDVIVEVPAHEPEDPRVATRRRILTWAVVIAVFVLVASHFLFKQRYDSTTVPDLLVGEWISSHPEYSDRYITLSPRSITFGIGGTASVKYTILGVEEVETDGLETVILHFRDVAGTTFRRSLVVDSSGDKIYFASQPAVVWQRYGS